MNGMEGSALSAKSLGEAQAHNYLGRVDLVAPQQVHYLIDLDEVVVRIDVRFDARIATVLCPMQVVGHDIEVVHQRLGVLDVKILHIPVRRGKCDGQAVVVPIRSQIAAQIIQKRCIVLGNSRKLV
jgi:hypothetical protein